MSPLGRVLVVEDEEEVAAILVELLGGVGYTVTHVVSGADALAMLGKCDPDVVLLDLTLPGLPGMAVLAEIHRQSPHVPVIIVSGNEQLEIARTALTGGAFDSVPKPFDFQVLERVVAAAVVERGRRSGA
jgi:DNA-binding NtrC family response regulator